MNTMAVRTTVDFTVDYLVVGGGLVGLAVAERLSRRAGRSTILLEKNPSVGEETSSRNSEVIHAGIYYPDDSLKTRLCIRGKQMLYELCESTMGAIPYRRLGKWVVAQNDAEVPYLHRLQHKADGLGVETFFVPKAHQRVLEPHVRAVEVLCSPTTGIVDAHALMRWLHMRIEENGSDVVTRSAVTGIRRADNAKGYVTEVATSTAIQSRVIVNSAGLYSDRIANMMLAHQPYRLHYGKGCYYGFRGSPALKVQRLVYPVPPNELSHLSSLGVHLTLDLAGHVRFGPDLSFVNNPDDYNIKRDAEMEAKLDLATQAIQAYLPEVTKNNLYPDYAGIRPKLQGPGEPTRDFVIKEETEHGLDGFVNIIGIESPGLTAALAIGEMVDGMLVDR